MVAKDSGKFHAPIENPYMMKPPQLSKRKQIENFFYNSETGTIMGRTPSSWGKIGLFYLIFYGCLAGLVSMCMWIFYQTLDPRIPKWQLDRSIIGTNPGLGFRPMPIASNVESTLIWFKNTDPENYEPWVKNLASFLEDYETPGKRPGLGSHIQNCDYHQLPRPGEVCHVNIKLFSPCTKENYFGFRQSQPCVFLKLNKIYGWRPEFYNDTRTLPKEMPNDLKNYVVGQNDPLKRNTIWVSCQGENPADEENIGPIEYYPGMGFPGFFYPYENSEGYLSPLVAVQFKKLHPGVIVNVECKAWAKNIKHNRHERIGSVHFELLRD